MKPINEYATLASQPPLFFWGDYDPKVKYTCSCSALVSSSGLIFIDPLPLTSEALSALLAEAQAPATAILLTSGNHQRSSVSLAEQLSIPIYAPVGAGKEIEASHFYEPGDEVMGLRSLALPGFGPGETAFLDSTETILILGDVVINAETEGLQLLPKKYCENYRQAMTSLSILKKLSPEVVLMAHGSPVMSHAMERLSVLGN